ncbi:Leucine-rich repeat-containing 40 [Chlorella sorokiniana]|uniref:Leucine-rich repeat-containing 40 n=1 Tax=Chlorella sorokiniana TaxID=3076 RepID=A0A2P6TKD8_CHLSO|nr:Leucine-rich repeat-containing 40 [Chlorella sorokiniana]|eukprot:PRW44535.1 Leucine-rich repeat-containing 40 [Chlorella sorokiniana]
MPHSPPPPLPSATAAAEAEAGAPAGACIGGLPNTLLGRIMALTGMDYGRSLTLVSSRWHPVFFSEPSLWRAFTAQHYNNDGPAERVRLRQRLALLRRVAPHVQRFDWRFPSQPAGLASFLAELHSNQLAELHLYACSQELLAAGPALRQLTAVTRLVLDCEAEQGVSATLAALGSHLLSLRLTAYSFKLTAAGLSSIVQLTQLTDLSLSAREWPSPDLGCLTRLGQLTQLTVVNDAGSAVQLPAPASLPASLQRYRFESHGQPFQVGGCKLIECELWSYCNPSWRPSLLLSAAAPVRQPAALAGCTQLGPLAELSWLGAIEEQSLAALLQQASSLSSLDVHSYASGAALGAVPACITSWRGLTSLKPMNQRLADVPAGEYLSGLRSLEIRENQFTHLPDALTVATDLTSLRLDRSTQLSLGEPDKAVLQALPRLRYLSTDRIGDIVPGLLIELRQRRPGIDIYPNEEDDSFFDQMFADLSWLTHRLPFTV